MSVRSQKLLHSRWIDVIWTFGVLAVLLLVFWRAEKEALSLARAAARMAINKDIAYRAWSAERGGLYAPVSDKTPPNPYLSQLTRRDVTTNDGQSLTLINPAYMTRQVLEIGLKRFNVHGSITSLRPLRPQNSPDPWQAQALQSFEEGKSEAWIVANQDGDPRLRLMRPLMTEQACLKCHADQGYKLGDVRGGISVDVPLNPYLQAQHSLNLLFSGGAVVMWLLGIVALRLGRGAELRLVEVGRRWQASFDAISDGLCLVDGQGRIIESNQSLQALLDPEGASLLGRNIDALVRQADLIGFPEQHCQARCTLSPGRHDHKLRQGQRHFVMSCDPITGPERSDDNTRVLVFHDVTELKQVTNALQQREEELFHAQRLEAVGRLAGGIAHDFNNLLTVIQGSAEFLQRDLGRERGDNHASAEDVDNIFRAARRGANLVSQLLAYGRRQILTPEVVEINAVVREAHSLLQRVIGEDIELVLDLMESGGWVFADPTQLQQVLLNLSINARDAMREGGRLELRTDSAELAEDLLDDTERVPAGLFHRVHVRDNGQGIAAANIDRVFDPFFTTKDVGEGSGLGLSTVYGIVRQSGGFVRVDSEPGRGSCFTVWLPSYQGEIESRDTVPSTRRFAAKALSILVVEDEGSVARLTRRFLTRARHRVVVAQSAKQALEMLAADPKIDLVISDVVMPDISGVEMIQRMHGTHPALPVLFMSGYMHVDLPELAAASRFIQKPFTSTDLLRMIDELMAS